MQKSVVQRHTSLDGKVALVTGDIEAVYENNKFQHVLRHMPNAFNLQVGQKELARLVSLNLLHWGLR